MRNNTKIVATLGPASSTKEVLKPMIEAGVNVCRLNFSHADHETHLKTIQTIIDTGLIDLGEDFKIYIPKIFRVEDFLVNLLLKDLFQV